MQLDKSEKKLQQFVGTKPDLLENMPSMVTFMNLSGMKGFKREALLKAIELGIPYDMTRKKVLTGEVVIQYDDMLKNAGLSEEVADYAITTWTHILKIDSDESARQEFANLYSQTLQRELSLENQPSWTKESPSAIRDKENQPIQNPQEAPLLTKKKSIIKGCISSFLGCGCAILILACIAFGIYYFAFAHKSDVEVSDNKKNLYEFGSYPVKPNGPKEPITWEIVDEKDGVLYLVSHNIVDVFSATEPTPDSQYNAPIRDISIIMWLNKKFLPEAFTKSEQKQLFSDESDENIPFTAYTYTREKVRVKLLSEPDLDKYYPTPEDRQAKPTEYAADKLIKQHGDEKVLCSYWIISSSGPKIINKNGIVCEAESILSRPGHSDYGGIYKPYGMRPMIKIKKPKQKDS